MGIKNLIIIFLIVTGLFQYDAPTPRVFADYTDTKSGYTLNYPVYWGITTDIDTILAIQDGEIDLIREEELSDTERESYKVLIHAPGEYDYISNVAVLVYPLGTGNGSSYADSESAVQAFVDDFDQTKASGTYFLEETYFGESHAYVYRRNVDIDGWTDDIRITYYLTASTTHAYFLAETVHESSLGEVEVNQFNQVIQSFRVIANESGRIDPGLDWGAFKPGDETVDNEAYTELGRVRLTEEFENNSRGWPVSGDARIVDGTYILDSQKGFPFTVRNTGMGQIGFDFECSSEVAFLDGDETAGYGIVFGYRDDDNYFAYLVTQAGQWLVIEERHGEVELLVPWTGTDSLAGDTHTIKVIGDYQTLNEPELIHRYALFFYVDDVHIGNIRVNRVLDMSGWYGVFVSSDLQVAFEWFETRNYIEDAIMTLDRYE